jgi:hypothetical protein
MCLHPSDVEALYVKRDEALNTCTLTTKHMFFQSSY